MYGVFFLTIALPAALLFCMASSPCLRADSGPVVDQSVTEYRLPNGLRVILRDEGPSARETAIWLRIGAGAGEEPSDAEGVAHFIEHMAFNGSERFPGNMLTETLRNAGLAQGADQNAETSIVETIYQFSVQNGRTDQTLLVMDALSEIAQRIAFEPSQIEKERSVILEEMRSRSGPQQRSMSRLLAALFPGTRLSESPVIGTQESVKGMNRDALLAFYRKWYVPGNATILISGNLSGSDFGKEIEARFAEWEGEMPVRDPVAVRNPTGVSFNLCVDPELPEGEVSFVRVSDPAPVTNAASLRRNLVRQITTRCLAARLENATETAKAPAEAATVRYDNLFGLAAFESAVAAGKGPNWPEALQYLAAEIQRAREQGFSEEEVALARERVLADYRAEAEYAGALRSSEAVRLMLVRASRGEPQWDVASVATFAASGLEAIKVEEVNGDFRTNLGTGDWLVSVETPDDGGRAPTEAKIRKLLANAGETVLPEIRIARRIESLLEQQPTMLPNSEPEISTDASGVASRRLPNGITVNYAALPEETNEVILRLTIPGGEIEETEANRGITDLAAFALNRMVTTEADSAAVRAYLTREGIQLMASAEADALTVTISASRTKLAKALEVTRALLLKARVTPEAIKQWKNEREMISKMENGDPSGQALWAVRGMLFGNDLRKSRIPDANVQSFQLEEAQAWLDRLLKAGGMELALVGIPNATEGLNLVAAYLSDLDVDPLRVEQVLALRNTRSFRTGECQVVVASAVGGAAGDSGAAVMVAFPGAAFLDGRASAGLKILSRILAKRLLDTLREKEGLVYAIGVMSETGDAYPDRGGFVISGQCDPTKALVVARRIEAEVVKFSQEPFTDSEIAQAEKEIRSLDERRRQQPFFVARQLSRLVFRGYDRATLGPPSGDLPEMDAVQLKNIARTFLSSERRIVVIARPEQARAREALNAPAASRRTAG